MVNRIIVGHSRIIVRTIFNFFFLMNILQRWKCDIRRRERCKKEEIRFRIFKFFLQLKIFNRFHVSAEILIINKKAMEINITDIYNQALRTIYEY